jgi:hypothetical protein
VPYGLTPARRTVRPLGAVFYAHMGAVSGRPAIILSQLGLSTKSDSDVTFESWPVSHGESNSL